MSFTKKNISILVVAIIAITCVLPVVVSAHEVYVLPTPAITRALATVSPNPFSALSTHMAEFLRWAAGIALVLLLSLRISFWRSLQHTLTPFYLHMKKYAPLIERITIGVSLVASAYAESLFGPEIPLTSLSLHYPLYLQIALYTVGVLMILGFLTRFAGIVIGLIYLFALYKVGFYLVSYMNYLATAILLIMLGGSMFSIDRLRGQATKNWSHEKREKIESAAFFMLRVFYGSALIFAAFYAKLIHSNLALDTVVRYHLTTYFPFDALFLVLGAFLVECTIAAFIILGFQLRLTLIVFTVFLTSSIIFFGESVWPHIILFGLNLALFVHGYDRFTLLKKAEDKLEPVL